MLFLAFKIYGFNALFIMCVMDGQNKHILTSRYKKPLEH